ncbi:IclR family transcriptional regulator C-terminal domain-containing protein [Streptomyces glaucescens]|uniref:IclR family transcriptional regulator domain-containing protein n=1 Tax=Streptomyces glaucescens TaxID=1907 RepID=UPI0006942428|nr:IclR family transcriptional regulator C-terminal domain-containing protein [Streptomyces glaucescens]
MRTGPATLRGEPGAVVEQGHGVTVEEPEPGLTAVAAPVRAGPRRRGLAAISVSGPVYRLHAGRLPGFDRRAVAAGAGVSRRTGRGF